MQETIYVSIQAKTEEIKSKIGNMTVWEEEM